MRVTHAINNIYKLISFFELIPIYKLICFVRSNVIICIFSLLICRDRSV